MAPELKKVAWGFIAGFGAGFGSLYLLKDPSKADVKTRLIESCAFGLAMGALSASICIANSF